MQIKPEYAELAAKHLTDSDVTDDLPRVLESAESAIALWVEKIGHKMDPGKWPLDLDSFVVGWMEEAIAFDFPPAPQWADDLENEHSYDVTILRRWLYDLVRCCDDPLFPYCADVVADLSTHLSETLWQLRVMLNAARNMHFQKLGEDVWYPVPRALPTPADVDAHWAEGERLILRLRLLFMRMNDPEAPPPRLSLIQQQVLDLIPPQSSGRTITGPEICARVKRPPSQPRLDESTLRSHIIEALRRKGFAIFNAKPGYYRAD